MKTISKKVWCHLSSSEKEKYSIHEIRESNGKEIYTFAQLIK